MKQFFATLILFLCLLAYGAQSRAEDFSPRGLGDIPILHEGRYKPLDSFAKYLHKNLSGYESGSESWLAQSLFNPAYAENLPAIKVSNPELISLLSLPVKQDKRYSFIQLSKALRAQKDLLLSLSQTPQEKWTSAQRNLMALQEKTFVYGDILGALTLYLPLSVELPSTGLPPQLKVLAEKDLSFAYVIPFESFLRLYMQDILEKNGEDMDKYSDTEQAAAYLSFSLMNLSRSGETSSVFKVIPLPKDAWLTPWQYILKRDTPISDDEAYTLKIQNLSAIWQELAYAYHKADQAKWDEKVSQLKELYNELTPHKRAIDLEHLYNQLNPFFLSFLLYVIALILYMLAGISLPFSCLLKRGSLISLSSGLILHLCGIVARIYILGRPPVSTLYESILFVGFICVAYALFLYMYRKQSFWLALGIFLGIIIHILGFSHNQDGDSFLALPAVLNTNFWLATHVICITIGYAFCLMTSMLAHFYMAVLALPSSLTDNEKLKALIPDVSFSRLPGLHHLALLSLLFAAIGTVLGGIWADQSWGRFWGWDPKENGALLIVLWVIWALHGRISGALSTLSYMAGLAFLSVIVALSWFGVNLLSVGLHAYGFTDGAAYILGAVIVIETLLIGFLYYKCHLRK